MATEELHVIVGAGPVGSTTALELVAAGGRVRVVTRRGSGPVHAAIERVAADAADPGSLAPLVRGAAALYNCANPPYHRWSTDWPPLAASLLHAAEDAGAVLVTMGNLYGYGPVDGEMTETTPLAATSVRGQVRARMWQEALAAHDAGRVRVTEARAGDFFGPGVTGSTVGDRVVPRVLAGKPVKVLGDPDVPHSFSYVPDVARTLTVLARDSRAWGRPWHVPSAEPLTQREMVSALSRAAGRMPVPIGVVSPTMLKAVGLVVPALRGLDELRYQFDRPFRMDSSLATSTFGLQATPLDEAVAATVGWYREQAGQGRRAA
jgi:nucleoside-diphosphate-sugar epimerase